MGAAETARLGWKERRWASPPRRAGARRIGSALLAAVWLAGGQLVCSNALHTEEQAGRVSQPDTVPDGTQFAAALAADGRLALVGAPPGPTGDGAVYVVRSDGGGEVRLVAELRSGESNSTAFGASVAIHDQLAVVSGSTWEGNQTIPCIYTFRLDGALAVEAGLDVVEPDSRLCGAPDSGFGTGLALTASFAYVGSPGLGALSKFRRRPSDEVSDALELELVEQLDASSGAPFDSVDMVGFVLAVSGETVAAVGYRRSGNIVQPCMAFFSSDNSTIKLDDLHCSSSTISSLKVPIALDGDYLALGIPDDPDGGVVIIFERQTGPEGVSWNRRESISVPGSESGAAGFGSSVAIQGGRLIVGVPKLAIYDAASNFQEQGAAFAFTLTKWRWIGSAVLRASDPASLRVGLSAAILGDVVLVGALQPAGKDSAVGDLLVFQDTNVWLRGPTIAVIALLALGWCIVCVFPVSVAANVLATLVFCGTADVVHVWYVISFIVHPYYALSGLVSFFFLLLSVIVNYFVAYRTSNVVARRNRGFRLWLQENHSHFAVEMAILVPFNANMLRLAWSGVTSRFCAPATFEDAIEVSDSGRVRSLLRDFPQFIIVLLTAYQSKANLWDAGTTVEVLSFVTATNMLLCSRNGIILFDTADDDAETASTASARSCASGSLSAPQEDEEAGLELAARRP